MNGLTSAREAAFETKKHLWFRRTSAKGET